MAGAFCQRLLALLPTRAREAGILLLGLLCPGLFAEVTVVLEPGRTRYDIGRSIMLLEDGAGALSAEQALAAESAYTQSTEDEPNKGFSPAVYWVRFALRSSSPGSQWMLDLAYAPLDRADLYVIRDGQPIWSQAAGVMVSRDRNPAAGRTIRFWLDLGPGEAVSYLLRVESGGFVAIPIRVWEADAFQRHDRLALLVVGMYFGLMLVMILYNGLILVSSRNVLYLYYILFVAFHAVFQAGYLGVGIEYVWRGHPEWNHRLIIIGATFAVAFNALFTRKFLQKGATVPRLRVLLDVSCAAAIAVALGTLFLPYVPSLILTNTSLLALSVVYIAAALAALRRGYTPARIYLVAEGTLFFAAMVMGLRNFRVLPSSFFTGYMLQIGSVFEVALLSLALADRINELRRQATEAEHELRVSRERELRATEEKLYFDGLTGLPNRNRLLADAPAFRAPALYLVNIDRFTHINDFYGNSIGDAVIMELKRRIEGCPPNLPAVLYRLHADEYALVTQGGETPDARLAYGRRLQAYCHDLAFSVDGQQVRLHVSIGIALATGALLEQADMALAEARRSRAGVGIYDPSMETMKQYANNLRWVGVIRDALTSDGILAYFQPIRSNATGEVAKYESLIRLRAEDGGVVSPGEFLPIAKASQLYPEVSRAVIRRSLTTLAGVEHELSVNLSIEDIEQEETVALIRDCLRREPVASRLVFEILESESIQRYDVVSSFVELMKREGCRIAIDDFGSGYSSFEHILRLEVDYLKLDRSLIHDLDHDANARTVVETIQQFALKLGIQTVAEYVHSAAVQAEVERLGVNYSQGYYIGEPRPAI